jgi:hypothetical protein
MRQCRLLLALASLAAATPLEGQITVSGIRDLDFGVVIRGVQTTVAPNDPIRSGRFSLSYVTGGRLRLRLTLPTTLARTGGGGSLPISFRNGDGIIQNTAPGSPPDSFNPGANINVTLTPNPDANVWLGGAVSPSGTQPAGSYQGTIVLTVTAF